MMNPIEELKLRCAYVLAVAAADLPSRLKYELIFDAAISRPTEQLLSLNDIYGFEDQAWENHEEQVREYAVVIEKLLADLEKIEWPEGA